MKWSCWLWRSNCEWLGPAAAPRVCVTEMPSWSAILKDRLGISSWHCTSIEHWGSVSRIPGTYIWAHGNRWRHTASSVSSTVGYIGLSFPLECYCDMCCRSCHAQSLITESQSNQVNIWKKKISKIFVWQNAKKHMRKVKSQMKVWLCQMNWLVIRRY